MLVLTRRLGESIVLPALSVTFRVLAFHGHSVRIGIKAPSNVVIMREELLEPATYRPEPSLV
jgi:carbon storage regulator CsrA